MTVEKELEDLLFLLGNKSESYKEYISKFFLNYKYICIFGMGELGRTTLDCLVKQGFQVDFFCDNDEKKRGTTYNGIACIGLQHLIEVKDDTLVLVSPIKYKEIFKQLKAEGINYIDRIMTNKFEIDDYFRFNKNENIRDNFYKLFSILQDSESKRILLQILTGWLNNKYEYGRYDDIFHERQYFINEFKPSRKDEVFVDGGAFDGDTLNQFLDYCDNSFEKAILFELSKKNYARLLRNLDNLNDNIRSKIDAVNFGLGKEKENIKYSDLGAASCTQEDSQEDGCIVSLDSVLKGRDITFLKMDIEGYELDALMGAAKTIKKCKPKLAICIYHSAEEYWKIPLYIKSLVPEYKIYIRHHTDVLIETVCYAIC